MKSNSEMQMRIRISNKEPRINDSFFQHFFRNRLNHLSKNTIRRFGTSDFLLKPFSFERFYKSVNKVKERLFHKPAVNLTRRISVKADKRIYQIDLDDLLYIESCGDYTTVCCTDKKLITHETLKSWEEKLKGQLFQKIHRSILINLQKIDHIDGNLAIIGKHKLLVSETFREDLIAQLLGRNITRIG